MSCSGRGGQGRSLQPTLCPQGGGGFTGVGCLGRERECLQTTQNPQGPIVKEQPLPSSSRLSLMMPGPRRHACFLYLGHGALKHGQCQSWWLSCPGQLCRIFPPYRCMKQGSGTPCFSAAMAAAALICYHTGSFDVHELFHCRLPSQHSHPQRFICALAGLSSPWNRLTCVPVMGGTA